MGKVSATWPFGCLDLTDSYVELRMQPRWVAGLFGAKPLRVAPADDVEVFPARGMFGATFLGIRCGDREAYFRHGYFTGVRVGVLLGQFQSLGYRVSTTERKIVYI